MKNILGILNKLPYVFCTLKDCDLEYNINIYRSRRNFVIQYIMLKVFIQKIRQFKLKHLICAAGCW